MKPVDPSPPRPFLENDSLKNRLVALTHEKFSLQTVSRKSAQVFTRAMKALALPVSRRWVLPGEANPNIKDAQARLAAMPKGTKGLFRRDGAVIIAGQGDNLLGNAIRAGLDLSEIHLVRAKLAYSRLPNVKMPRADLRLANLTFINLEQADLSGSDLRRAVFSRSRGQGAKLEGVDFSEARAFDARFNSGKLRGAKFDGTVLQACEFNNADLRDCDFTKTVFKIYKSTNHYDHTTRHKVEMKGADLRGAMFAASTDFSRLDLSGANLDGVIITNTRGEPIPGAVLSEDGSVIYSEILDVPGLKDAQKHLPGPGR